MATPLLPPGRLRPLACRIAHAGLAGLLVLGSATGFGADSARPPAPRDIILILSDDHRFDFLGFHPDAPPFLETPNLDRMAAGGAHLVNAFVATSLCSPSRASILTGQFMHRHRIVDNQREMPEGTVLFPRLLQEAGFETAFIGKWHMGHDSDEARPGFDHWVSFAGQGEYFDPELNIDGTRRKEEGYLDDILTGHALEWLRRPRERPRFLMLSFKAVHFPFQPPPRHRGRYRDAAIPYPDTMANTDENYATQPRWVEERRYGIHGIDHMQTGALDNDPVPDFDALYRMFCETVHGLDENVGRILAHLDEDGGAAATLTLYLGDNGFALGEHGFYDKRDAYEESIRIPMLAYAPGLIPPGTRVEAMVQNIDIAPTLLDAAGLAVPPDGPRMDGMSFLPLLRREPVPAGWRRHILYEYHWEWNFPATPTLLAIRDDRFKYFYAHGVWDRDGFYDLATDPHERHNLIDVPAFQDRIREMRGTMFREFAESGGLDLPIRPPAGDPFHDRKRKN